MARDPNNWDVFKRFGDRIGPNLSRSVDEVFFTLGSVATDEPHMRTSAINPATGFSSEKGTPNPTSTLRVISGRLSRSLRGQANSEGQNEALREVSVTNDLVFNFAWGSYVPYAGVHEFGFAGTVTVPRHSRVQTMAFGKPMTPPKTVEVREHTREVTVTARPYANPGAKDALPKITDIMAGAVQLTISEATA